jgi:AGZA family xanthine/uracil permease-like MFS transporter
MGFISYPLIKLLSGRGKEAHWFVYLMGAVFAAGLILYVTHRMG